MRFCNRSFASAFIKKSSIKDTHERSGRIELESWLFMKNLWNQLVWSVSVQIACHISPVEGIPNRVDNMRRVFEGKNRLSDAGVVFIKNGMEQVLKGKCLILWAAEPRLS